MKRRICALRHACGRAQAATRGTSNDRRELCVCVCVCVCACVLRCDFLTDRGSERCHVRVRHSPTSRTGGPVPSACAVPRRVPRRTGALPRGLPSPCALPRRPRRHPTCTLPDLQSNRGCWRGTPYPYTHSRPRRYPSTRKHSTTAIPSVNALYTLYVRRGQPNMQGLVWSLCVGMVCFRPVPLRPHAACGVRCVLCCGAFPGLSQPC